MCLGGLHNRPKPGHPFDSTSQSKLLIQHIPTEAAGSINQVRYAALPCPTPRCEHVTVLYVSCRRVFKLVLPGAAGYLPALLSPAATLLSAAGCVFSPQLLELSGRVLAHLDVSPPLPGHVSQ